MAGGGVSWLLKFSKLLNATCWAKKKTFSVINIRNLNQKLVLQQSFSCIRWGECVCVLSLIGHKELLRMLISPFMQTNSRSMKHEKNLHISIWILSKITWAFTLSKKWILLLSEVFSYSTSQIHRRNFNWDAFPPRMGRHEWEREKRDKQQNRERLIVPSPLLDCQETYSKNCACVVLAHAWGGTKSSLMQV